jgi:hypothetical protein
MGKTKKMKKLILAIDFDGFLCEAKYPKIGRPNTIIIELLKKIKNKGHKLILWTCRSGKDLEEAIKMCNKFNLKFDKINENLDYIQKKFKKQSTKIYADYYFDDKNGTIGDILKLYQL